MFLSNSFKNITQIVDMWADEHESVCAILEKYSEHVVPARHTQSWILYPK